MHDHALQRAEMMVIAYNDAVERILGAPKGSIHLMDTESLKEWFPPEEPLLAQSKRVTQEAGIPGFRNP